MLFPESAVIIDAALPSSGSLISTPTLERFGFKYTAGGAHISRTIMLDELAKVLSAVPERSRAEEYRNAVEEKNVLGKTTGSTRKKSFRHLRELYGMDESLPVFRLLRQLHAYDSAALPQLAFLLAWSRDPLLRATTIPVLSAREGDIVETSSLADAIGTAFPNQYSSLNQGKIARNAASSWTQSGHLVGRSRKRRARLEPRPASVTMALVYGGMAGFHGIGTFSNPWCRLLDLNEQSARAKAMEAHRSGLITLRAVGDVIELSFPQFAEVLKVST